MAALLLCSGDIQFLCQTHSNFNTFNKSRLLMVPAEGTDGIDDLIDFLQGFAVHDPVEFLEV